MSLKELRQAKGLTQEALADLVPGLSLRTLRSYEQGQRELQKAATQTVVDLARVLGCSVEELLSQ